MADPKTHKRYLDYRETHMYFGGKAKMLDYDTFEGLDREHIALAAKGEEGRDDEEEARFAEVSKLLFRD
jgi:hypothetical protein